jgi:thymidine phosphorylase
MDIENLINKATDDISSLSRKELESLCHGMLKANMADRQYDNYLLEIAVQLARENAALTVQLESLGETPWEISPGTGKAKVVPLFAGVGR